MERIIRTKTIKSSPVDIDEKSNRVVVYYAAFDNKDRVGDVLMKTAANKTISQLGPKGSNEIVHYNNHNSDQFVTIPKELVTDNYGIKGVIELKADSKNPVQQMVREWYMEGLIKYHSIGYWVEQEQTKADYNELQEIGLIEGSNVWRPANPKATTTSVNLKSFFGEMEEEEVKELLIGMKTLIGKSRATDETIKSMEAMLKQLTEILPTIQPAPAIEPEKIKGSELVNLIKSQKLTL